MNFLGLVFEMTDSYDLSHSESTDNYILKQFQMDYCRSVSTGLRLATVINKTQWPETSEEAMIFTKYRTVRLLYLPSTSPTRLQRAFHTLWAYFDNIYRTLVGLTGLQCFMYFSNFQEIQKSLQVFVQSDRKIWIICLYIETRTFLDTIMTSHFLRGKNSFLQGRCVLYQKEAESHWAVHYRGYKPITLVYDTLTYVSEEDSDWDRDHGRDHFLKYMGR